MRSAPSLRTALAIAALVPATAVAVVASAHAAVPGPPGANPERRGYELVSLPDARATAMYAGLALVPTDNAQRPPAIARAGGRAFVTSVFPIPGEPDAGQSSSYTAVRTPTGWTRSYNGLPPRLAALDAIAKPIAWTPDLATQLRVGQTLIADPTDPSVVPTADDQRFALWLQRPGREPEQLLNVPAVTTNTYINGNPVARLSQDGATVVFQVPGGSLVPGTPDGSIYRRQAGAGPGAPLTLLSTDPGGTALDNPGLLFASEDATTLVMNSYVGGAGRLFRRSGDAPSEAIDAPRGTAPGARTDSAFAAASADARTVFFVTRDPLLPADTVADDADLYRWDADGDVLTLVSRGTGPGGDGGAADCPVPLPGGQTADGTRDCDVAFLGADRAGAIAYFLSPERLDGAADAVPGGGNLYARRRGEAAVRYVTTLDPADADLYYSVTINAIARESWVADDGALLVRTFAGPGGPYAAPQVVRIDPDTLQPRCVSCVPSGADATTARLGTRLDELQPFPDANATADGRHVFFETAARLVAADANAAVDVYDYDAASGTRSLVTAGATADDSTLVGLSDDGADVLFSTHDTLTSEDRNGPTAKVYDARRDGGFPEPPPPPAPCREDGCRPAPAARPQQPDDPASASYRGPGNVAAERARRWTIARPSAAVRARLARTGRATVAVRLAGGGGTVRVALTATLGGRRTTVASASTRLTRAGTARLPLRLSAAARRALRAKGRLKVTLAATVAGEPGRQATAFTLTSTKGR